MANDTKDDKWASINQAGSGSRPSSTDNSVNRDTAEAIDRADNCSKLHQEVDRLADRSGK
jgi:hypothetical protein